MIPKGFKDRMDEVFAAALDMVGGTHEHAAERHAARERIRKTRKQFLDIVAFLELIDSYADKVRAKLEGKVTTIKESLAPKPAAKRPKR